MKISKTTILTTKYFLLALLVAFSFSCSPEDGATGAAGTNGTNGADGNANVETYTFDISTLSGTIMNISTPQLTQDVLDNDAILVYIQRNGNYYPIPGTSFGDEIKTILLSSIVELNFYDRMSGANSNVSAGTYTLLKMVIIESNNTTAGRISSKQQVYNELNQAGVNINDYYAVCDYYGIDY